MDVHPPLAKLLITLVGWLAGFDGNFNFKQIGMDYLEPGVPYVAMRMLPAICGILTVPIIFLTLKAAGCQTLTATLGALLITFGRNMHCAIFYEYRSSLTIRKWPYHSSTIDPIGLSTYAYNYIDGISIYFFY